MHQQLHSLRVPDPVALEIARQANYSLGKFEV